MRASFRVLSDEERHEVHERTLRILAQTGVRVDTALGRKILKDAGAHVDENTHVVSFPRALVEESLRLAPKQFSLGARRADWDLPMNAGECSLLIDGEARFVLDLRTGKRRLGTLDDWLQATCLIDALDDIGVYWGMVEASDTGDTLADWVDYWWSVFGNFSKHVQDVISTPQEAPWLLEVLQVIFGDKDVIRREHPLSYLLCPQSPLIIEGLMTDAYLALIGWDIPVAIMPMPLRGATAPGSLISTVVVGNCEMLATNCLLQAAAPGTPVIYAPCIGTMDPRSGRYSGGAIEGSIGGAAATEMARYYGLPAESTGMGTDEHVPDIQAGYERALTGLLGALSWPDILVGPGLLGGSMILSLAQLMIDVEIFRLSQRAWEGIGADQDSWLEDVIHCVGPGGNFLSERSTAQQIRGGGWYISELGVHQPFESWVAEGRPRLLEIVLDQVDQILQDHEPLPLGEDVERELERIYNRAETEI